MLKLAFAVVVVGASAAAWAGPAVAVMPFRDLSGGKGAVGEAIRETVTTDLKDVPGLTVVERGAIDKILAEHNLQSTKTELDPLSTVRVGKLLGATLIVTGAYQKAAASVRVTARFVKVETGEVVGSAKVDGAASDFLELQDRITAELLKSAGMGKQVERFAKRARPKVKSIKTLELYGDAVAEPNEEKKVEYLKLALNEDPAFEYALRDLDALEKRLRSLEKVQRVAEDKKIEDLRKQIAAETDLDKRRNLEGLMAGQLMTSRRWLELRKLARTTKTGTDGAAFYLVMSHQNLHDWDAVLRDGEQFLQRYPSSMYFAAVKSYVEQAISKKRKIAEGKDKVVAELAKIEGDRRWDLCQFAYVYRNHDQHQEARRFFRACMEVGTRPAKEILSHLVGEDMECGDWSQAKKDLQELRRLDPETAKWRELSVPSDG
jgi:TolB-like protein